MSVLGEIVESAVSAVIAQHPNLFNPQTKTRAGKTITREIIRSLIAKRPGEGADEQPQLVDAPAGEMVAEDDPRAVGYVNLRSVAGAVAPFSVGEGRIFLPTAGDAIAVRAFAEMPARSTWVFVTDNRQLTAWDGFFGAHLPEIARRDIRTLRDGVKGSYLPWPWPPAKSGKIYEPGCEDEFAA